MYTTILINILLVLTCSRRCMGKDYYEILGVDRTADLKEIRRAFKKLAVIEHPDKNNDTPDANEKFIQLTRAYETLKDPSLRKQYDDYGEDGLGNTNKKGTYHSWSYYANNFGIYDDDPRIITLDENDYFESIISAEKVWIVNFYSAMCGHCHRLAPIWKKIAEELDGAVRVGAVNCEDDWQLCRRIGIRSYPTLMHYPKNSRQGIRYSGEKTYAAIMNYVLAKLEVDIDEIDEPLENVISRNSEGIKKPMLIFICSVQRNCFTSADRLRIAAIFENVVDVRVSFCSGKKKCGNAVSQDSNAVFLSASSSCPNGSSCRVVQFENVDSVNVLKEKILERLPEPRELDADEFQNIKIHLTKEHLPNSAWLLCFHIGRIAELNLTIKRLSSDIENVNLGKINCGKQSHLCNTLGINSYPMWGILKSGGAFELYHGKNTLSDIAKFVYSSIKATNVWALTADQVISILDGKYTKEAWFLDWYAPWCPPCMQFIKEVRKASTEFDWSVVRFGTIDCTVHSVLCHRFNIRSYPTAMLVNGTETYKFSVQMTASNIVQFINEARNPTVIRLTLRNFEEQLSGRKGKVMWLVKYFVPWCAPCQRLTPEWVAVANSMSVLSFVKVASVDCETESALCSFQGIRSYPTIRLYSSDNQDLNTFISYNGQRDSVSILRWIARSFPVKVRDLNPSTLETDVLADRNVWIVDFFTPWCEHCRKLEPQFAIAAQLLKEVTQFGRFNCEVYITECTKAGIQQYPTLIAYGPRYNGKKIMDGFRINGTVAEHIKYNILDFVSRAKHDEL